MAADIKGQFNAYEAIQVFTAMVLNTAYTFTSSWFALSKINDY